MLLGRENNKSWLLDLPLEVVLKILEVTHPSDLLVVSRVNKQLRALLMHRGSANLWKFSLSFHEPSLPECPRDISLPRWVNLVYGNVCSFCFATEVQDVDWYLRVRICPVCTKSHVKTSYHEGFSPLSVEHGPQPRILFERLIPARLVYFDTMAFFVFTLLRSWRYLTQDYEKVKAEYFAIPDDDHRHQFLTQRTALANETRVHAQRCERWSNGQKPLAASR